MSGLRCCSQTRLLANAPFFLKVHIYFFHPIVETVPVEKKNHRRAVFLFGAFTPNSSLCDVIARHLESRVTLKAEPIKLLVRQARDSQHVHATVGGQERN